MAESFVVRGGEQDGLSVGRESRRLQGRSRSLKCWHSFEITIADAEGFNVHRRQHRSIRFGEDVKVRRSLQAVACGKRCVRELGKPHYAPGFVRVQVGRRKAVKCDWGVLSGILLGGRESLLQGEGPDGSTEPAKETHTGQCRAGTI
jgi:hypothetical protein